MKWLDNFIVSEGGQWEHPGELTAVPTDNGIITMDGVPYPLFAMDETGYGGMIYPGGNYQFRGNMVYEIPMAYGGDISIPDLSRPNWLDKAQKGQQVRQKIYTDPLKFAKAKEIHDDSLSDYLKNKNIYESYSGAVYKQTYDEIAELAEKNKRDYGWTKSDYPQKPKVEPIYKEKPKEYIPTKTPKLEIEPIQLVIPQSDRTLTPYNNTRQVLRGIQEEDKSNENFYPTRVVPAPDFRHGGWLEEYQSDQKTGQVKETYDFPYPTDLYRTKNKSVTEQDVEKYNTYLKNNQGNRNVFYDTHDLIQDQTGNYSWQPKKRVDYQSAVQGTPLGQMIYKTFETRDKQMIPVDQFGNVHETITGLELGYSPYNIWSTPTSGIGFYDTGDPNNILSQLKFAEEDNSYPTVYFLDNKNYTSGDENLWIKNTRKLATDGNIYDPEIEKKTGQSLKDAGYTTLRLNDSEHAADPRYKNLFGYDDDLLRLVNPDVNVAGALPLNKRIVNRLERIENRFDSQDFDKRLRKEEKVKKMLLRKAGLPRTEENLKTLMHYNFTPLDVYSEINRPGYESVYPEKKHGGRLEQYQGDKGSSQVKTYASDPNYFDSHAVLVDNSQANELFKSKIYAGTHGWDPSTNSLVKLDKPVAVPKAVQEMSTADYGKKSYKERFESNTPAGKEVRKAAVAQGMKDMVQNPAFYAPGAIAAAALAGPTVMPAIGEALSYPAVVGSTTLPGVTAGNALGLGMGAYGAYSLGKDIDTGYYTSNAPTSDKVVRGLETGLNLLGTPGAMEATGMALSKATKPIKDAYNTVATGESALPIAWKSPAVGLTQSTSDDMFRSLANSGKLTPEERALVLEYQHGSRNFTGRGLHKVDQEKRQALNNIINKYETEIGDDVILTRMFSDRPGALGAELEKGRLNFGDRPTSFTAGVQPPGYGTSVNRLVVPKKYSKQMGDKFLVNQYDKPSDETLSLLDDETKDWASWFGTGANVEQERELIGTGLDFRRIGKVKNDIGGYDWVVKPNTPTKKFADLDEPLKYRKGLVENYNPETQMYEMYEVNLPNKITPGRSYEDVQHKMKNLRKDLGIGYAEHLANKYIPGFAREVGLDKGSGMIIDPATGRLFDSNTRYWLNREYGFTPKIDPLLQDRSRYIGTNYGTKISESAEPLHKYPGIKWQRKNGGSTKWLDMYQGDEGSSQVERRDPNQPFFPSSTEAGTYESQYSLPEVSVAPNWTEAELERNRLRDEYIKKDKNVFRHWYDKLGYDKDNVNKRANQFAYNKLAKQYLKGDKDQLTEEQRKFIEKSEYANRLQPSIGSRFAQGITNPGFNLETLGNLAAPFEYPTNLVRGAVMGEFTDALMGQTPSPYFVSSDLAGTSPNEAAIMSGLMDAGVDVGIGAVTPTKLPGSPSSMGPGPMMLGLPNYSHEVKNVDYFKKMLDSYGSNKLSNQSKKYFEGIINSVRKQDGMATKKQYDMLQRLRTGDFNYGKRGAIDSSPDDMKDWIKSIKNDTDLIDQGIRFQKLPELNNPEASEVLENFMTRINTREGKRRLKKLGITTTDVFDDLKIVADENTLAQYWYNRIGLNPKLPEVKRVTRHEIEHAVQDAYTDSRMRDASKFKWTDLLGKTKKSERLSEASKKITTDIDESLKGLELRRTPEYVDWNAIQTRGPKEDASQLFNYMSDKQRATNYFASGSEGQEKSAFLGEVQQYMMDQGILPKTSYVEVTPEMVKNTFTDAIFDETGGGKYLRLFQIMKPTEANYKLIADNLNKMLGIAPVIGLGTAAALQKEKYGGWLDNNQDYNYIKYKDLSLSRGTGWLDNYK